MTFFVFTLFMLALMSAETVLLEQGGGDNKPIAGIGPTGSITKLHTGFKWTEGPIADGKGNIYFSDLQGNKIH